MTDLAAPRLPVDIADGAAGPRGDDSDLTPLDHWLADQQDLTAVERFSQHHDNATGTDHQTRYRDLVPLSMPKAGEQYVFEVDLDTCTGCKACVAACHSLNGLDDAESFRSVGTLLGGPKTEPIVQTVTTACHHCLDPACLNGCPTLAYEKDPVTGIVRHLDDQCIGCQYCTLTCPYEVPTFNHRLGIVRKCDMCSSRLAEGEAPACVQACPTESIAVRVVSVDEVAARATVGTTLVPHAPDSSLTRPTTRYLTRRTLTDDVEPADHHSVEPAHANTPLVVTLVLTQLAVGMFGFGLLESDIDAVPAVAFLMGVIALGASLLHLGRPTIAWKAVLGLRRSWVSREIVAFSAFAAGSAAYACARWAGASPTIATALGLGAFAIGIVGVFCSVMIYAATKRRWWTGPRTLVTFALTTAVLGLAGAFTVLSLARTTPRWCAVALLATTVTKLTWDALPLRRALHPQRNELDRSVGLLLGPLRSETTRRFTFGAMASLLVLLAIAAGPSTPAVIVLVTFALLLYGEYAERRLFFLAVSSPRMPGELR